MRLSVKVVGGSECECEASPDSSVEALKRDVEVKLNLGKDTEQKLLFRGKALQDGTQISDYNLSDGSKLKVVLKRRENNITNPSSTSSNESASSLKKEPRFKRNVKNESSYPDDPKKFSKNSEKTNDEVMPNGKSMPMKRRESNCSNSPSISSNISASSLKTEPGIKRNAQNENFSPDDQIKFSKIFENTNAEVMANGKSFQTNTNFRLGLYQNLDVELNRALRPHFSTNEDTEKVVAAFKKIFQQRLAALSLDDIERFARTYNTTNVLHFHRDRFAHHRSYLTLNTSFNNMKS